MSERNNRSRNLAAISARGNVLDKALIYFQGIERKTIQVGK